MFILLRQITSRLGPSMPQKMSRACSTKAAWEEETLSHYSQSLFYGVHIGDILKKRYQILFKLGYGGNSTVWLGHDLFYKPQSDGDDEDLGHPYRALKIGTVQTTKHETEMLKHIKDLKSAHIGQYLVRTPCDTFDIKDQDICYSVLVQPPLGKSLLEYQDQQPNRQVIPIMIKNILIYLLRAIDFLHTEAGVVHTDIKPDNILFSLPENEGALLKNLEVTERNNPSCSKVVENLRTIYKSRIIDVEITGSKEFPILIDFGTAKACKVPFKCKGLAGPRQYRSPEVILEMDWDCAIDIWSMGVMICDLILGKQLFPVDNDQDHLALMIAYIGPPSLDFLQRSKTSSKYFDEDGKFKGPSIPQLQLNAILGDEDEVLLDFLRSMLTWKPEDRKSAKELCGHAWMPPTEGQ